MCFDLVGDVQVEGSKNEQSVEKNESKKAILGKAREHAATWFCHAAA